MSLVASASKATSLKNSEIEPATGQCADFRSSLWPDISLIGVALIWGINIPLMKTVLEQLDSVYLFNALRLPISTAVLIAFAVRERRNGILPKSIVTRKHLVIYALMVSVLYQLLFLIGMDLTTPGNTALIIATVPMWTALLAWIFLGERILGMAWVGLSVALIGTIIVAMQTGVSTDSKHLAGNLVVLGAALLWSAGTVYSRPLLTGISAMQLAAASALIGLPFHIVMAVVKFNGSLEPLRSIPLWLIILFSGVLSSGLSQPMWHFGVRHAGAAHAAIVQNLIPLVALLAAWIIIGSAPTSAQVIGGALILTGLVTMRFARHRASLSLVAKAE